MGGLRRLGVSKSWSRTRGTVGPTPPDRTKLPSVYVQLEGDRGHGRQNGIGTGSTGGPRGMGTDQRDGERLLDGLVYV